MPLPIDPAPVPSALLPFNEVDAQLQALLRANGAAAEDQRSIHDLCARPGFMEAVVDAAARSRDAVILGRLAECFFRLPTWQRSKWMARLASDEALAAVSVADDASIGRMGMALQTLPEGLRAHAAHRLFSHEALKTLAQSRQALAIGAALPGVACLDQASGLQARAMKRLLTSDGDPLKTVADSGNPVAIYMASAALSRMPSCARLHTRLLEPEVLDAMAVGSDAQVIGQLAQAVHELPSDLNRAERLTRLLTGPALDTLAASGHARALAQALRSLQLLEAGSQSARAARLLSGPAVQTLGRAGRADYVDLVARALPGLPEAQRWPVMDGLLKQAEIHRLRPAPQSVGVAAFRRWPMEGPETGSLNDYVLEGLTRKPVRRVPEAVALDAVALTFLPPALRAEVASALLRSEAVLDEVADTRDACAIGRMLAGARCLPSAAQRTAAAQRLLADDAVVEALARSDDACVRGWAAEGLTWLQDPQRRAHVAQLLLTEDSLRGVAQAGHVPAQIQTLAAVSYLPQARQAPALRQMWRHEDHWLPVLDALADSGDAALVGRVAGGLPRLDDADRRIAAQRLLTPITLRQVAEVGEPEAIAHTARAVLCLPWTQRQEAASTLLSQRALDAIGSVSARHVGDVAACTTALGTPPQRASALQSVLTPQALECVLADPDPLPKGQAFAAVASAMGLPPEASALWQPEAWPQVASNPIAFGWMAQGIDQLQDAEQRATLARAWAGAGGLQKVAQCDDTQAMVRAMKCLRHLPGDADPSTRWSELLVPDMVRRVESSRHPTAIGLVAEGVPKLTCPEQQREVVGTLLTDAAVAAVMQGEDAWPIDRVDNILPHLPGDRQQAIKAQMGPASLSRQSSDPAASSAHYREFISEPLARRVQSWLDTVETSGRPSPTGPGPGP